jgi:AAA+ superfamily predicted ATPase
LFCLFSFLVQLELCFEEEILSKRPPALEVSPLDGSSSASPPTIPASARKKLESDPSQLKAVEYALSRRLAIIQGPPGTGKTFVGVQLVKTLLEDHDAKILCICYTNHALDSFLESLLDEGIPANSMVRFGSQPKVSTRIQGCCYDRFQAAKFEERDSKRYFQLKKDKEEKTNQLIELWQDISTLTAFTPNSWTEVKGFFENTPKYFDVLDQFKVPNEMFIAGMQTVGKNNQKLYEDSFFKRWCRNGSQPQELNLPGLIGSDNLWLKTPEERRELLKTWRKESMTDDIDGFIQQMRRYNEFSDSLFNLKETNKINTLSSRRIIACTTTYAAKNRDCIDTCCPNIILVEEAAEIHESHIITNLTSNIKRLIMIGDHKQLRPKMEHYPLRVDSGEKIDFDISLFERLVKAGYEAAQLQIQHRMRPTISSLIKDTYPLLRDHPKVLSRDDIKGMEKNVLFINHNQPENTESDAFLTDLNSKSNVFEAQMIIRFTIYLLQQGYCGNDIVILTPYLGQLMKIRSLMRTSAQLKAELSERDADELDSDDENDGGSAVMARNNIRVATIDNFQGEESKIILASLVRSNHKNDIGFVSGPERINVLCSRARDGFYIFGNKETFSNARNPQGRESWKSVINKLEDSGCVVDGIPIVCQNHHRHQLIEKPQDFDSLSPEGGCAEQCGAVLPLCKNQPPHSCYRKCHPNSAVDFHARLSCDAQVTTVCGKGHSVKKKCYEESFSLCTEITSTRCSTGHNIPHKCNIPVPACKKCEQLRAEAERKIKDAELKKREMEEKLFELQKEQNQVNVELQNKLEMEKLKQEEDLLKEELKATKNKLLSSQKRIDDIRSTDAASTFPFAPLIPPTSPVVQNVSTVGSQQATVPLSDNADPKTNSSFVSAPPVKTSVISDNPKQTSKSSSEVNSTDFKRIINVIEEENWLQALKQIQAAKPLLKIDQEFNSALDVDWMLVLIVVHCSLNEDSQILTTRLNEVQTLLVQESRKSKLRNSVDCNIQLLYQYCHLLIGSVNKNMKNLIAERATKFLDSFSKVSVLPAFYLPKTWKFKAEEILKNLEQRPANAITGSATVKEIWSSTRRRESSWNAAPSMDALLKMVGLETVKKSFLDLYLNVMTAKYIQKIPLEGFNFNSLFIGNPGTGKTTVAHLFASFLTEISFFNFEASVLIKTGSELITMGVAGLEEELKEMKKAGGGVIFIDEAYQLTDREGRAIRDCILGNAEKTKGQYGKLVWILAGYKKQMEDFLKENPGLPSRFSEKFTFEDYTDEELEMILKGWFDRGGRDVVQSSSRKKKEKVEQKQPAASGRNSSTSAFGYGGNPYNGMSMYGAASRPDAIDQWGNTWKWDNQRNTYYDEYDNISGYGPAHSSYKLGARQNPIVSNSTGTEWCYDVTTMKWYNRDNSRETSKGYPGKPVESDEENEPGEVHPFSVSNPKWIRIAAKRVGQGRNVEGFGNARSIRTLFQRSYSRQVTRITHLGSNGFSVDPYLFERNDLLGPKASLANLQASKGWQDLQQLEGLSEVKESLALLLDIVISNADREEEEKRPLEVALNRVFLGNPGTGKTTVAKLYGQILADLGMLSKGEVVLRTASDFVGSALGKSEEITKGILEQSKGCVLVIDEAYGLYSSINNAAGAGANEPYREAVINTLVEQVQGKPGDDKAVILIGYRKEMEMMFKNSNPGFSRRFQLENAFEFKDYDDDSLVRILKKTVEKEDLHISVETAVFAVKQLEGARARPNFGNAGAVNNLLSDAKLRMQKRINAQKLIVHKAVKKDWFEKDDFKGKDYQEEPIKPVELLKDLVGCQGIRKKLETLCKTVEYYKAKGKDVKSNASFNYLFVGNPGTGKTTIARLMGKMFHSLGLIPFSECIEKTPSSLQTGYVGQAAEVIREVFKSCKGKVLFIDEAYQLNPKNGGPYMKEVTDEMVALLTSEEYKNQIIVILAGYQKDIEELLKVNEGLVSRFNSKFIFEDLTVEEIVTMIPDKLCKEDETNWNPQTLNELPRISERLKKLPSFSNGRDVETFIKLVIAKKIDRFFEDGCEEILTTDLEEALNEMERNRKSVSSSADVVDSSSSKPNYNYAFDSMTPPPPPALSFTTETQVTDEAKPELRQHAKEKEPEFESAEEDVEFEEDEWDGLSRFVPHLQTVLEEKGWNNEETVDMLSDASSSSPYKDQLLQLLANRMNQSIPEAQSLFKKWQKKQNKVKKLRDSLKKKKLEMAKQGKKVCRVPIWRCGVCGRADQPYIACYVAPFIVRYEERPLC